MEGSAMGTGRRAALGIFTRLLLGTAIPAEAQEGYESPGMHVSVGAAGDPKLIAQFNIGLAVRLGR